MRLEWKLTILTVSFLAIFLAIFGCQEKIPAGPMAPDFSLSDLYGHETTLEQHRGNFVLLDFWATWCPPCRMSIPELVKLEEKYGDRGLVILGVSMDDPMRTPDEHLQSFKEKFKINYTILRYDREIVQDYFGHEAPAIPTVFLIDREGRIRDKFVGFKPGAIEKSLTRFLG